MDVIEILGRFGWILIPIGLFLGLFGYRVYRVSLFLVGVFAGLAIAAWIISETGNNPLYLILGLVIGVVVGFTPYFIIKFSFFVLGMVGGFVLSFFIISQIGLELGSSGALILVLVSAFVGGVLTVLLEKNLIIVFTSIIGTALIHQATIHYFPPQFR